MSELLCKPKGTSGKTHDITINSARTKLSPDWNYVGFGLYKLKTGEKASEPTGGLEAIIVMVEGKAELKVGDQSFGEIGDRMNVFERIAPHCVYVPRNSVWEVVATTECTIAICTAPATADYPAKQIGPDGINTTPRGKDNNTRYIHNIAMEDRDVASALLVTEVFTPSGNWSSYPPHRHDEDNFPTMTYLEETYYHRLNPAQGYGHQRVFTEDLSLDENIIVYNEDVVLVPKGHHPCGVPYGYEMYYLNVMAGPRRNWRFENHSAHDWIFKRDNP